jgi:hypothetical protein
MFTESYAMFNSATRNLTNSESVGNFFFFSMEL